MGIYERHLLLEDAYFFLNQAKSLSDTPAAKRAKQRYIRTSVVLSWQALEFATKHALRALAISPVPNKLSERLKVALTHRGKITILDMAAYKLYYKLRNDIVHANSGSPEPTLQDAERVFSFCKDLISALALSRLEIQVESLFL